MKCKICSKKIGLIHEITCKCNKCNSYYCLNHRLSEDHFCIYNYQLTPEEKNNYIQKNKCSMERILKL